MQKEKKVSDMEIRQYVIDTGTRQTQIQKDLRAETMAMANGMMMVSPACGEFLALLAKLIGAKRTLEVGTFTGYSALSVAAALPEGGEVVACDMSEEYTAIARRYWARAGLSDKINLQLGEAVATLDRLIANGEADTFDLAFIDADKNDYDAYYERCLKLVRPGGLIVFDNMFWGRSVADADDNRPETVALRQLNIKIRDDERVDMSLIPFGDGMTFLRRR
ncbi:class I SAM-dependent methyltransferase [Breoghania sp. JC706]|uniref:O-methyltransferase n=1 Tax=Breoghania sp. JC706 TaxID=3117732 RepID=UPI003008666D